MTMLPDIRTCPKCKNVWSRNPDVGVTECPYCQKKKIMKVSGIFSGKKRKKDDKDEE